MSDDFCYDFQPRKDVPYGNMRSVLGSIAATTSYTSTTTVYTDVDTIVP